LSGWFAPRKKKEDRLRGKVDLLLRRKEIRVVLLAWCKSNKHATVSVFVFLLVFAGFMGLAVGTEKEEKEKGSTNFLTLMVGKKELSFVLCSCFARLYRAVFLYQHVERVFPERGPKIGQGERRPNARVRCGIKNYT